MKKLFSTIVVLGLFLQGCAETSSTSSNCVYDIDVVNETVRERGDCSYNQKPKIIYKEFANIICRESCSDTWREPAQSATVKNGGNLKILNTILGDVTVESGGHLNLRGTVMGDIINYGSVTISGTLMGNLDNRNVLFVKSSGTIFGKVSGESYNYESGAKINGEYK